MHFWEYAIGLIVYTGLVFWAGTKFGNGLEAEARARLAEFETGAKTMGGAFNKKP